MNIDIASGGDFTPASNAERDDLGNVPSHEIDFFCR